ncbi:hypothetical protein OJHNALOF_01779 [Oceanimonas sp. MB9]|nr:hypothetical protein [Oceanimonas sp. MB9]
MPGPGLALVNSLMLRLFMAILKLVLTVFLIVCRDWMQALKGLIVQYLKMR